VFPDAFPLRARLARKLQLSTFTGAWNGPRPHSSV